MGVTLPPNQRMMLDPAPADPAPTTSTTPTKPNRNDTSRLRAPPAGWEEASNAREADRPEMGEMLQAAWDNQVLNWNMDSGDVALGNAYQNIIDKGRAAGLNIGWNPVAEYQNSWGAQDFNALLSAWHEDVQKQIDANPKLAEALGPISRQTIGEMANQLSRDAQAKYLDLKERRGEGFWSLDTLAEFGVGMGASLTDPFQAATLPVGGGSKTVVGAVAKGAAVNAGVEALMQPSVVSRQVDIGNIATWEEGLQSAGTNVAFAAGLGGLFEGGGKTIDKTFFEPGRLRREREAAANAPLPDSFEPAREALTALARTMEDQRPEDAAVIRKAMYDAERDYETMRQRPESVSQDEFADAVEAADARVRGLQQFMDRPQRMADAPERTLDTTDDGPVPRVGETLTEDGKPVAFTRFDPRELGVAPDEMQYKRYAGEDGVNNAISDVGAWHAPSSGKVLVFERANGEKVIVDGHQRRALARQMMASGDESIRLDGYLYREADGWTAADMRLKGAQKNIREGRSDVLDTAQALRERPDAIDASFPVSRSNIRQARQLARLSPEAWDLTRAGVLEPQFAALIGQVAPDRPEIHGPLARTLVEAAPENVRQAENIVSEALLDYAERDVASQPSLFGDDNLGRAVMYKERAQIMDAAYAWLRSERSVFKALVDKGDIARALGNELVDAANLTAKDQVELAIAAVMHSRKAGVRTAVTDMISRALDSVRREGVPASRAGQQVAREIRALIEERGFRALLDAEGPRPPEMAEAGPLFDGPGSKAHAEQADMLEGDLRPEGREDPGVDLAKAVATPDPVTSLVDELKGAGEGNARSPEQVLADIRRLLQPPKAEGEARAIDPAQQALDEFNRFEQAEKGLREALAGLSDAQRLSLVKMQYPDAYAPLTRLEGLELEDAIVSRVMAGEVLFARRGDAGNEITYNKFHSDVLNARENKIVEMALNGIPNLDIAVEVMSTTNSVGSTLVKAKKKLAAAGTPVEIPRGASANRMEGFAPGALRQAVAELLEEGLEPAQILKRLQARGMNTNIGSIYVYSTHWRQAKAKGVKFAKRDGVRPDGLTPIELEDRIKAEFGDGASALTRAGEINIVDTPPKWAAPDATALTDAKGRVTIFSSNVNAAEVRGLILHEVGVHAGLEAMLGAQGKAQLLERLSERWDAGDESVLAASRRVPVDTPAEHVMEETLAYLVQHAPKSNFVQQLFADLRAWLYKTFPKLRDWMTLTDADLQSLALGAVRNRIRQRAQSPAPLIQPQLVLSDRTFGVGQPDELGFITSAERALSNPPPRFRDVKRLTADQWRKLMREGGASKEAFTWQIEPALAMLKDQGLTGDITREAFEEALARTRVSLSPFEGKIRGVNAAEDEQLRIVRMHDSLQQAIVSGDTAAQARIRARIAKAEQAFEADFSDITAPGARKAYRQQLFLLPESVGKGYKSHNWNSLNPVGHLRWTERVTADGERVSHMEEAQSDIHQEGAKYNYKGEGVDPQEQRRIYEAAREAAVRAENAYDYWVLSQKGDPLRFPLVGADAADAAQASRIADPTGRELYREAVAATVRHRQMVDAGQTGNAWVHQPPRVPMEDWEEPFVRFMLLQGANDGVDLVTFATHATLHRAVQNEGTKKFYDQRLPQTLKRVANSLGVKVETVELDVAGPRAKYTVDQHSLGEPEWYVVRDNGPDFTGSVVATFSTKAEANAKAAELRKANNRLTKPVPAIRLTPEAKDKLQAGIVMYARRGGREADAAVGYEQTRAGGVVSTSETKRARGPRNGENPDTTGSRETASGQPGAAGRADGGPGGGAGAGPEPGGQAKPGAGSTRALATEALPDAPVHTGDWNERVELTPEQRAYRREQFRDFVDNAEIAVDTATSRGDYLFKGGKRYIGPAKAFEARMYRVNTTDDMHPDWIEALDPSETAVKMEVHGPEAIIHDSHVADAFRSTGLGTKLYRTAIDAGLAEGRIVNSDPSMSENSIALWKSLRAKGYDVIQRVPDALLERGDDGQYSAPDSMTSIFFIARKKPPVPELPEPTRDVMNKINEARDLAEHIPACVKGKRRA